MDEQNCMASSSDSSALRSTFRFYQGVRIILRVVATTPLWHYSVLSLLNTTISLSP